MRREDEAPVFETGGSEVQEEGPGEIRGFQVVDHLGTLPDGQLFEGFQLDNGRFVTDKVSPVLGREPLTLVLDGKLDLSLKGNPAERELQREGVLIDRIQEPMAQMPVHLERGAENQIGLGIIPIL